MATFGDHNDALRAHTDWRRYISAHVENISAGWLHDRSSRYGLEAMVPSAQGFKHMVEDTVSADICWMSHEMMDLVQHAMATFDSTEPMRYEDAFIPHGLLVLPEPWYSADVHGKTMAQRMFLWRMVEHGCVIVSEDDEAMRYTYDLNAEGKTHPVLRITTLSHIDDADDYTAEQEWLIKQLRAKGWPWGVVHTTTIPLKLIHRTSDTRGEGDHKAGWLAFWRVVQKLMGERIVTSERRKPARAARREAQRFGFDPGAPRVIELRRHSSHDADPEGERVSNVEWTHRWIVRGHWRQQWYPAQQRHKQIWIGAYEKGPDDLPLVIRERVWNWDR